MCLVCFLVACLLSNCGRRLKLSGDAVVKYTAFKGLKVEGGWLTLVARRRREAVSNMCFVVSLTGKDS